MGKKQAQFRLEENFYQRINEIADSEGVTLSEVVRSALSLYATLYDRSKESGAKFFIEYKDSDLPKCEVILPWIQLK